MRRSTPAGSPHGEGSERRGRPGSPSSPEPARASDEPSPTAWRPPAIGSCWSVATTPSSRRSPPRSRSESLCVAADLTDPGEVLRVFSTRRRDLGTRHDPRRQRGHRPGRSRRRDHRRAVAADAREQPDRAVPMHPPGAAVDDRVRTRPHRGDRLGSRQAGRASGRGVLREQARRPRSRASGRGRGRPVRRDRERGLPGLRRHADDRPDPRSNEQRGSRSPWTTPDPSWPGDSRSDGS